MYECSCDLLQVVNDCLEKYCGAEAAAAAASSCHYDAGAPATISKLTSITKTDISAGIVTQTEAEASADTTKITEPIATPTQNVSLGTSDTIDTATGVNVCVSRILIGLASAIVAAL